MAYNILIVDDEATITNGLAYDIDWNRIGVLEVFKANSVPLALEYLQNNKIDVVITDIRMPEMDGLELAQCIRKQWRFAKIIFISGYDEFEYAQKAIDLGVFSYITKPIPNERLLDTVARALRAIEEELDGARLLNQAVLQRDEMLWAWRERELNAWIAKGRALPTNPKLQRAGLAVGALAYLILITVDEPSEAYEHPEQTMTELAETILFAGRAPEQHFVDAADRYVLLASQEEASALEDALRFMKGMAEAFQQAVRQAMGCTVSLFFGNVVPVQRAHEEYIRLVAQATARRPGNPGVIMVPGPIPGRASRVAEQVRAYVRQNLRQEITVADIAAHLHLHPNYLLRLFKEETGEAVIEYLIRERIQRAKELLADPSRMIYEVAEAVGYDSVSHFSRIFKRETGLSPKDFQQRAAFH